MKKGMGFAGASGQLAVLVVTASLCCALAASAVAAPPAPAAQGDESASAVEPVYTRARLVSVQQEPDGRLLVRLKLLPRSKIPFSIQTFRAANRALLDGIAPGAWVQFTARRIDGENTFTSIRMTTECKRFEPCD